MFTVYFFVFFCFFIHLYNTPDVNIGRAGGTKDTKYFWTRVRWRLQLRVLIVLIIYATNANHVGLKVKAISDEFRPRLLNKRGDRSAWEGARCPSQKLADHEFLFKHTQIKTHIKTLKSNEFNLLSNSSTQPELIGTMGSVAPIEGGRGGRCPSPPRFPKWYIFF